MFQITQTVRNRTVFCFIYFHKPLFVNVLSVGIKMD